MVRMIVFKGRNFIIISVLIATLLTFVLCVSALYEKPIGDTSVNKVRIVLDAGHGGIDSGVSGVLTSVKESELNLAVVKKLEKYLTGAGMNVVLTRSTDAGLYGVASKNLKRKDMEKRREIIHNAKPHLVVSIHMNKYSLTARRGAQVFYKKGDEESKLLAEGIQECFNTMEEAVRTCSALTGDYYILNCSEYPSVICECGFLSNPEDESLLITEEYQDTIAYTIFKGIVAYLARNTIVFTD
jgi:N-acetylmuramoyl-L-alanine amidase